jgi:hypothetical protein
MSDEFTLNFDTMIDVQPTMLGLFPASLLSQIVNDAAEEHRQYVGEQVATSEGLILKMAKGGAIIHSIHSARVNGVVSKFALVSVSTSVQGKTSFWKIHACSLDQLQEEMDKGSPHT